jgi:hypothetical protein
MNNPNLPAVGNDALMADSDMTTSELWFPDGNIILEARNRRFKVHHGVLSLHSPVFKDMFTLPIAGNVPAQEGEPPVVVLHDAGMDVEYMLREFYGYRCVDTALEHRL